MGNNQEIRIEINEPAGAVQWLWADEYEIKWTSTGYSSYCRIELYHQAKAIMSIAERAANDGTFSWEVPTSLEPGNQYQIKVTSMVNSKTFGFSQDFVVKERTEQELKDMNIKKQREQIEFHVAKFEREYKEYKDPDAEEG